jgi:transposase-like protein
MKRVIGDRERAQRAAARLRVLQHFEQVSRNISRTCRFFGISRTLFYEWRRRYQRDGLEGLKPRLPGPRVSPFRTAPHIEALVPRVRQERQYGIPRLRLFLRRYHAVSLSPPTIRRILREHHVPRVSQKRYRPGPKRRPELHVPGQSVQVDVKHLKTQSGRLYQFTAIDEATRYRVLKIYDHNSIQSAIHSINERSARPFPRRFGGSRLTTAPNGAPTSPGTYMISALPTSTSRPAARSPIKSSAVIAPTRMSSTGG